MFMLVLAFHMHTGSCLYAEPMRIFPDRVRTFYDEITIEFTQFYIEVCHMTASPQHSSSMQLHTHTQNGITKQPTCTCTIEHSFIRVRMATKRNETTNPIQVHTVFSYSSGDAPHFLSRVHSSTFEFSSNFCQFWVIKSSFSLLKSSKL